MSPAMPARALVACALVAWAGAAHAEGRRKVAVVDLTGDPAAKQLHDALYDALQTHWALRALGDPTLDAALVNPLPDEDHPGLELARQQLAAAEDFLAQFSYDRAVEAARDGMTALTRVSPSAAAKPAADVAFVQGLAELGRHQPAAASAAFQLAHRLDLARQVDEARYKPAIVSAWRAAIAAQPAKVSLEVRGDGTAWIDGVAMGPPGAFTVEAGSHLVQLAGPDRDTVGKVTTDAQIAFPPGPIDERRKVARARLALAHAPPDAVARAPAMQALASLLGVHDAVLIWKTDAGALIVQTWRDVAPGFSALREHADEPPLELLAPLSPPEPPRPPKPDPPPKPAPLPRGPEPEPEWYQKRWVQASVAGGVLAAVVGAILVTRHAGTVRPPMMGQW